MLSFRAGPVTHSRSHDAGSIVAVPGGSYPGGKSGAGIFQRLINLIPRHRILISAFAGHCGIVRNIRPAEHTVVIDPDPDVCQWWSDWRRSPEGRALEIHNCDSIEWLRFQFGLTEYSNAPGRDAAEPLITVETLCKGHLREVTCGKWRLRLWTESGQWSLHTLIEPIGWCCGFENKFPEGMVDRLLNAAVPPASTPYSATGDEAFIFADPPYVLSERSHGKQYAHELCDNGHRRLLEVLTRISATSAAVMVCGYDSPIYASLEPWRSIDHRVPTRGGLQDERIWMNYPDTDDLHDFRYIGNTRRERERIRRRQVNWLSQLNAMSDRERAAMLAVLNQGE